jgi:5'-nucleotidase
VKCNPADYDPVNGFEVVSNTYQAFPITADPPNDLPEDPVIVDLLQPYQRALDSVPDLTILAGFSPQGAKRTPPEDGDSALGNLVSTSMWLQLGVQTDFSMTNTSGIRTDLDPGVVPIDELFNIFPFANTITTMELSGVEVRELFDFIARRSQGRGCESQGQIAGARVRLNCTGCNPFFRPDTIPTECTQDSDCTSGAVGACDLGSPFQGKPGTGTCLVTPCAEEVFIGQETAASGKLVTCNVDGDCAENLPGQCVSPPSTTCTTNCGLCWSPLPLQHPEDLTNVYSLATNNYVAEGGSGFKVLQRNTTQLNTNILQRDALVDYMREGRPCGYQSADNGLHPCNTDDDCESASGPGTGFVCECPGSSDIPPNSLTQSCVSKGKECGPGQGLCVRQDCRDGVAQYLLTACLGVPGKDLSTCQNAISACDVGGEECKYLSCVDATESALVDGRITVIQ